MMGKSDTKKKCRNEEGMVGSGKYGIEADGDSGNAKAEAEIGAQPNLGSRLFIRESIRQYTARRLLVHPHSSSVKQRDISESDLEAVMKMTLDKKTTWVVAAEEGERLGDYKRTNYGDLGKAYFRFIYMQEYCQDGVYPPDWYPEIVELHAFMEGYGKLMNTFYSSHKRRHRGYAVRKWIVTRMTGMGLTCQTKIELPAVAVVGPTEDIRDPSSTGYSTSSEVDMDCQTPTGADLCLPAMLGFAWSCPSGLNVLNEVSEDNSVAFCQIIRSPSVPHIGDAYDADIGDVIGEKPWNVDTRVAVRAALTSEICISDYHRPRMDSEDQFSKSTKQQLNFDDDSYGDSDGEEQVYGSGVDGQTRRFIKSASSNQNCEMSAGAYPQHSVDDDYDRPIFDHTSREPNPGDNSFGERAEGGFIPQFSQHEVEHGTQEVEPTSGRPHLDALAYVLQIHQAKRLQSNRRQQDCSGASGITMIKPHLQPSPLSVYSYSANSSVSSMTPTPIILPRTACAYTEESFGARSIAPVDRVECQSQVFSADSAFSSGTISQPHATPLRDDHLTDPPRIVDSDGENRNRTSWQMKSTKLVWPSPDEASLVKSFALPGSGTQSVAPPPTALSHRSESADANEQIMADFWENDELLPHRKAMENCSDNEVASIVEVATLVKNDLRDPREPCALVLYMKKPPPGCHFIVMAGLKTLFQNLTYWRLTAIEQSALVKRCMEVGPIEAGIAEHIRSLITSVNISDVDVVSIPSGTACRPYTPLQIFTAPWPKLKLFEQVFSKMLSPAICVASRAYKLKTLVGPSCELILQTGELILQTGQQGASVYTAMAAIYGGFMKTTHKLANKKLGVPLFQLEMTRLEFEEVTKARMDRDFLSTLQKNYDIIVKYHLVLASSRPITDRMGQQLIKDHLTDNHIFLPADTMEELAQTAAILLTLHQFQACFLKIRIKSNFVKMSEGAHSLVDSLNARWPGFVADIVAEVTTECELVEAKTFKKLLVPECLVNEEAGAVVPLSIRYGRDEKFMSKVRKVYRVFEEGIAIFDVVTCSNSLKSGQKIDLFYRDESEVRNNPCLLEKVSPILMPYDLNNGEAYKMDTPEAVGVRNKSAARFLHQEFEVRYTKDAFD